MSQEALRSAHHLIDTYVAGLAQRLPADSGLPGWLVGVVAVGIPLVGEPIMSRYRRRVDRRTWFRGGERSQDRSLAYRAPMGAVLHGWPQSWYALRRLIRRA